MIHLLSTHNDRESFLGNNENNMQRCDAFAMHQSHVKTSAQCLTKTEISSSKDLKSRTFKNLTLVTQSSTSWSCLFPWFLVAWLKNFPTTLIGGLQPISRDTDNDAAMHKINIAGG